MRRFITCGLVAVPLAALACSLVNAPNDVETSPTGSGGEGGAASGGDAGSPSEAGESGSGGSGEGGAAGSGGMAGSAGEPPVGPPEVGLIAISARTLDAEDQRVLSVLSEDGTELDREDAPVAALAYDGAAGRDVWFVFLAEDFPIDPARPADLEVRRFDDQDNSWVTISETTALPPPRADQLTVLNGRLAYLSYDTSDESESLTILDTRDLENIVELEHGLENAPDGQNMVGLLGARGSATNQNGDGGTLNLMLSACERTEQCTLSIQPLFAGSSITTGNPADMGVYLGTPAFASALEERRGFIAMYDVAASRVTLTEFDPFDIASRSTTNLPSSSQALGGMLLLECENVAGLAETVEQRLRSVSLQGGLSSTENLMRAAQQLYFEPFSMKAVSPYNADVTNTMPATGMGGTGGTGAGGTAGGAQLPDGMIDAFSVTGNGVSAPTVAPLAAPDWEPPADLAPLTIAVRTPAAFTCE